MRGACRTRNLLLLPFAGLLSLAALAGAQDASPQPDAPPADQPGASEAKETAPPPPLDLNDLLRPRGTPLDAPKNTYGGRDLSEWKEEFKKARAEVKDLEGKVDFNQNRLRQASAGDWNYTPAGGEAVDPEVLRIRAQLKRDRQSLETARQRLRDLQVEASLAGVPEEWRSQ